MKPDRIEKIVRSLRVRSTPGRRQERLEDVLAAHDRWRQSRIPSGRWVAKVAIAASIAVVVTVLAVMYRSPYRVQQTLAVSSAAEIITAGSLQRTFRQGGLEEVERQLDRAAELFGPWPTVLPEQGLFRDDSEQNQGKEHEYEVVLPKHSYCLCLTDVAGCKPCDPGRSA